MPRRLSDSSFDSLNWRWGGVLVVVFRCHDGDAQAVAASVGYLLHPEIVSDFVELIRRDEEKLAAATGTPTTRPPFAEQEEQGRFC
jgi:hypothetical protein